MTINHSSHGRTVTFDAIQLVKEAFRAAGIDPEKLDPRFVPYWLAQGKTIDEILIIAGWPGKQNKGAAA